MSRMMFYGVDGIITDEMGLLNESVKQTDEEITYSDKLLNFVLGDGEEFVLRPMNCPHHIEVYKHHVRSWRVNSPQRRKQFSSQFFACLMRIFPDRFKPFICIPYI